MPAHPFDFHPLIPGRAYATVMAGNASDFLGRNVMNTGRSALMVLCLVVLAGSVALALQGSGPLWGTAVAMVVCIGSILWRNRKERAHKTPHLPSGPG